MVSGWNTMGYGLVLNMGSEGAAKKASMTDLSGGCFGKTSGRAPHAGKCSASRTGPGIAGSEGPGSDKPTPCPYFERFLPGPSDPARASKSCLRSGSSGRERAAPGGPYSTVYTESYSPPLLAYESVC